jgi:hypothetical protein
VYFYYVEGSYLLIKGQSNRVQNADLPIRAVLASVENDTVDILTYWVEVEVIGLGYDADFVIRRRFPEQCVIV